MSILHNVSVFCVKAHVENSSVVLVWGTPRTWIFILDSLVKRGSGAGEGPTILAETCSSESDLVSAPVSLPELEFPSPLEVERGRREVDRSELSAFYLAVDHSVGDTLDGDQVLALGRKLRK